MEVQNGVISKNRLTMTTSPKVTFKASATPSISSLAHAGRRASAFETSASTSACTVSGRLENKYDIVTSAFSLFAAMTCFQRSRGGSSRLTRNFSRRVPSSRPEGCGCFVTPRSMECPRAATGASEAPPEIKEVMSTNAKT
ncbi:hypothetical protein N8152_02335 [bacterium]|nr:hypothetical protein [bacterium]